MANVIRRGDTVSAKMAEVYATINGTRYNFAQMINATFKVTKSKGTIPRLGAVMEGHRTYGAEGTFEGTMHFNQSVMRKLVENYKDTGLDTYFDVQVINDDPGSDVGRQSITYFDCNTDEDIMSAFDADGEYQDEDVKGTFEDFVVNDTFGDFSGFRA